MRKNYLHLDFKGISPLAPAWLQYLEHFHSLGFDGLILELDCKYAWKTWQSATLDHYSENDIKYPTTKTSNLATMTVLQEPITKWFKPKDGDPVFFNGNAEYKLVTQNTLDGYFDVDVVKDFDDLLPTATGLDGGIFGDDGYSIGGLFQLLTG